MRLGDDETAAGPTRRARWGADDTTLATRLRAVEAYQRALQLLAEAEALVREQQELESYLVALGAVEGEDAWQYMREYIGLAALDSVLGNAAADISGPGGGLWCGGAPRPWPVTGWRLDDEPAGPRPA